MAVESFMTLGRTCRWRHLTSIVDPLIDEKIEMTAFDAFLQ